MLPKARITWGLNVPRHIEVDRNDPIATTDDRVAVMVVSTAVCARAHRNDPTRFRHLVVDLWSTSCSQQHASFQGKGVTIPTFRRAGAILLVRVPATIMISLWRGLARKTTPRRSWSYRAAAMSASRHEISSEHTQSAHTSKRDIRIISTAQQARPKVLNRIRKRVSDPTDSLSRV
jgi:hypothetical protein